MCKNSNLPLLLDKHTMCELGQKLKSENPFDEAFKAHVVEFDDNIIIIISVGGRCQYNSV